MRHWTLLPIALLVLAVAIGGCGEGGGTSTTAGGPDGGEGTPSTRGSGDPETIVPKAPPVSPAADLGNLVPENAAAIVYVPSLESVLGEARKIVASFDEGAAGMVSTDVLLAQMLEIVPGLTPDMVDPSLPMAVIMMTPPGGGPTEPLPAVIMGVRDAKAARESMIAATDGQGPAPVCAGSFLAFAPMGGVDLKVADSAPAIAKGLAGGDVSVRLDLAKLVAVYGDALKAGMGEALNQIPAAAGPGQPDVSALLDGFRQGLVEFIDSAELLDLALNIDGATVSLHGAFTVKAGSPLDGTGAPAGDLAAMSRILPADYPISILASVDWTAFTDWIAPFMEVSFQALPEDQGKEFLAQWKQAMALYEHLGNDFGVAMAFKADGIGMAGAFTAKDGQAYLDGFNKMMTTGTYTDMLTSMGMTMTHGEPTEVAGYKVHDYGMIFDVKKLMERSASGQELPPEALDAAEAMLTGVFGKDGLHMRFADVKGKLLMVMGGNDLLAQTIKAAESGGTRNDSLNTANQLAGPNPAFLLHVEIRTVARQILDLMRKAMNSEMAAQIPEVPPGAPVPLSIGYGASGRVHRGGLSIDVGALADMVKALDK